jgi:hypothetical protein
MTLTQLQSNVLRVLAKNRSPTSYLAGGAILNRNWHRRSDDIHIFHDTDEEVADTAKADIALLESAGYAIHTDFIIYGAVDAIVSDGQSSTVIQWFADTRGRRKAWFDVGASFVVVDTLVHNFLHRTGILRRLAADDPYGAGCYRPGGCADVLYVIADNIDVSVLNPTYPRLFPRFVESAIWRYCAENGLNVCNGNRIDDRDRCGNGYCRLYPVCDRVALQAPALKPIPRRAA